LQQRDRSRLAFASSFHNKQDVRRIRVDANASGPVPLLLDLDANASGPVPLLLDLRIDQTVSEVPLTLVLMETYTTLLT
jgi:hypothetical protein